MSIAAPGARSVRAPDGLALSVRDFGGTGPDALLEHAAGFCGGVFAPLAGALGDRAHLWAADLRGHGESERPDPAGFDWSVLGPDCVATVAGLGLSRPFGIGHSAGATALLAAEQQYPGTFRALYCFEPILFFAEQRTRISEDPPLAEAALRRRASFPSREEALTRFSSRPPLDVLDPAVLRAYVACGFDEESDGTIRLRCPPGVEAAFYSRARRSEVADHLGALGCPVVIAYGTRSEVLTAPRAARIAAALPDAVVEPIAGLGHFGPLENPGAVAASVAATLLGARP